MKLWQKTFLTTLALVIIVVNVASLILLSNNHQLAIENNQQYALTRHNLLIADLKNSIIYTQLNERRVELGTSDVKRIARNVLGSLSSDTSMAATLFFDGEAVYAINDQPAAAERELLTAPDYSSCIVENNTKSFLLVYSLAELSGESYQLVSSYDISSTYELFEADFTLVRIVGIASALLVAGLLLALVQVLLRPLRNLSTTTREIASGELERRATVVGNDEVAEVAQSFNTMAAAIERNITELETLAESRQVFIGNLAHEMRTPLTSILGFADILRIKRDVSAEDRVEYAGVIVSETQRLQGLSAKLMELLSLGSGEIARERVDVTALATELGLVLQPLFAHRGLGFDGLLPNNPVYINADRELIKSLLNNLIDNAIKASSPGGIITLGVIPLDNTPEVRLEVADQGMGIPPEQIPLLTEPFYMLDKARTRSHGGAGLGLALCAEIARVHGTELVFESIMGTGTTVSITLPLEVERA